VRESAGERTPGWLRAVAEPASAGLPCLPAEGSTTLQREAASAEELVLRGFGARKKAEFCVGRERWTWQRGLAQPHTHTLVMWTEPTVRADALGGGAVPSVGLAETQDGNGAHPHDLQFSEESVSSLEPSLSASIFRRWYRGFQGELILDELRTGKLAVSPLELVGPETESPET